IVVVNSADMPRMSGLCCSSAARYLSTGLLMPRSMTSKPAPSSIIDTRFLPMSWISPYGADDDLADRLNAGLGQQRAQNLHAALHRVGRQQHLGDEQDAVAEIDADDAHAFHQRIGQHLLRGPAPSEKDAGGLLALLLEAVVKIVVHLFRQLLIVQAVEIKFLVLGIGHRRSPRLVHARTLIAIVQ